MTNIFYSIYLFTSKHKVIFAVVLVVFLLLTSFLSSRLKLEENILNVVPKDEQVERISSLLDSFKANERLVMHLYFNDSTDANPQELIELSQRFADTLQAGYSEYIKKVEVDFPDENIEKLYNYFYDNLPLYLETDDYVEIAKRTSNEGVKSTVQGIFRALQSPLGLATKQMLINDPFGLTAFPLNRMRSLQIHDSIQLYQNHLLTRDQRHLIFFITLSNPPNETANNGKLIDGLNAFIASKKADTPNLNIEYFGQAAVAVANANRIKKDIYFTVTLALAFLFLFISLFYRKVTIFFILITPGIFGALVALALLSLLKGDISIISLGVGSVLLGITIDYALHFVTHWKQQSDLKQLFTDITGPMLMSSLTTACAFLSLLFLRSEALNELGIFASVSVISAAIFTLLVLPHLLSKKRTSNPSIDHKPNFVERLIENIARFPFHKSKWAMGLFVLITVISLFTWHKFSFEEDMMQLNYMPDYLQKSESHLNAISTYSANNIYLVNSGIDIWEALEGSKTLNNALDPIKESGQIFDYLTFNNIVPAMSIQKERIASWTTFGHIVNRDSLLLKLNKEAVTQGFRSGAFSKFENLITNEPSLLNEEKIESLLSVFGDELIIEDEYGTSLISSIKLPTENKKAVLEKLKKIDNTLILDKAHLTSRLVTLLKDDFSKLVNISLAVVFVIILINYGRIELALITFAPILLSWLWTLGMMGLLGLKFNIVNIIICTFIFGLGIDYSIFVMQGLTQKFKYGVDNLFSYKKSIALSAITTLTGIGVLVFAQHPALKSIALLAIIGILSVIFLTFTIEPILYRFFISKRKEKGQIPFTLVSLLVTTFAFVYFLFGCGILMVLRLIFAIPFMPEKKRKLAFHWVIMTFCGSLIYVMANVKKNIICRETANFNEPAVIIANHHSFLDILMLLMFSPKVVMVTNDWVYYSPFFGKAVQFADFIRATKGLEGQLDKIKSLVKDGYSIAVFPEGTRSTTSTISRFHKGAFYLAEQLQLDIQPAVIHGTSLVMPKGDDFYLKSSQMTVKFLPRISPSSKEFGGTYAGRTKNISRYFKSEYDKLRFEYETPSFFKEVLMKNFIFKGPVLEWYLRVKFKMENEYQLFNELIPREGRIVDLGCGYGFIAYALSFCSESRQILGIDYDSEKIEVAKNCPSKPKTLNFEHGDVVQYNYGKADVFIVSDVLHYLLTQEQSQLLDSLAENLLPGGIIILRDGDASKKERHKGTQLTELFSTKSGFNKTRNKLNFISQKMIRDYAKNHGFELKVIDNTKLTSNTLFVLKKKS